ncbi:MAG: peptide chain release factor 2 [Coriobacteriia bacterium]|nr:peptide chain release factor 2 [Coriobacteriia bacterium]
MLERFDSEFPTLSERLAHVGEFFHVDAKEAKLAELEKRSLVEDFWNDADRAQQTMAQSAGLREELAFYRDTQELAEEVELGVELAKAENDEVLAQETELQLDTLATRIDELEQNSWFDGEFDSGDAIMTIVPGQGGREAQDWTDMVFRMYLKYAESKGWTVDVHEAPEAEEIGIDRAVFTVHGRNAYGMLRSEKGTHRLVRISPTDLKKRRQTTFAGVSIMPALPDEVEVDIKDEDVRVDVYRSSGPGGQSVNTTDSAVRLTHIPTGTVVTCQNEKSQHKNKDQAYKILRAKVYEIEQEKRAAELDELRGPKQDITWGSQIRNYVLYPYQMVKDVRCGVESGNVDAVLGGALDPFVIGYHRWRSAGAPQLDISLDE